MRIILITSAILLLSCGDPESIPAPIQTIVLNQEINTRDTCLRILQTYAQEDTFLYERFYDKGPYLDGRISYVKTGSFIFPDKKSGVMIYTPSDTTIAVELYSYENNKWVLNDKQTDLRTNGIMFYTNFQDYNFDDIGDIYINTCVSNGSGLSTGQLLTVTNDNQLVPHPETLEIRDMEPDHKKKVVRAKSALCCLTYKDICNETYKWVDNKLIMMSKPCECKE